MPWPSEGWGLRQATGSYTAPYPTLFNVSFGAVRCDLYRITCGHSLRPAVAVICVRSCWSCLHHPPSHPSPTLHGLGSWEEQEILSC